MDPKTLQDKDLLRLSIEGRRDTFLNLEDKKRKADPLETVMQSRAKMQMVKTERNQSEEQPVEAEKENQTKSNRESQEGNRADGAVSHLRSMQASGNSGSKESVSDVAMGASASPASPTASPENPGSMIAGKDWEWEGPRGYDMALCGFFKRSSSKFYFIHVHVPGLCVLPPFRPVSPLESFFFFSFILSRLILRTNCFSGLIQSNPIQPSPFQSS